MGDERAAPSDGDPPDADDDPAADGDGSTDARSDSAEPAAPDVDGESDDGTDPDSVGADATEADSDGPLVTEVDASDEYDVDFPYDDYDYDPEADTVYDPVGPEEDQEMPLADHIREMLKRLAVVVAVAGVVSLVTFPFAERLINFLWNSLLPAGDLTRPRLYGILELKLTELKVASLAGVVTAMPVIVYETYQFMRPGLYPHERRYYLAAIPTSLVLAFVGVSFAYFIVLPAIFLYFTTYTQGVAGIGFALGRTFDLILLLMGYMAVVFQIPLFIMLAMMMNLVTRRWLADRRLLFWGAFLGISFIFSPDPTGMAPIIVALTMIGLFEGTLLLTRWTQR